MIRRLLDDVPSWARANSPVLRYEMQKEQTGSTFGLRLASAAGQVILVLILLGVSVLMVTRLFTQPAGVNPTQAVWHILYLPTIGVQIMLSVILLFIGGSTVSAERRRQTWDHLRVTTTGAELLLRVRLLAVFYRVRVLFALAFLARFAIMITTLIEISSHRGEYLSLLLTQANSTGFSAGTAISPVLGIVCVAAALTAAFLLPLTQAALDVALSLLLTTAITQYPWSVMSQMVLVVLRVVTTIALALLGLAILQGGVELSGPLAWAGMIGATVLGDQGLLMMQISQAAVIWQVLPYGLLIGVGALLVMLIQAAFASMVLVLAVRRAERTE
jgi:hypothetical protein